MRRLICKHIQCRYHGENDVCKKGTVKISNAVCQSFEKGFYHYIMLVINKLRNTNMIPLNELDEDMQIGLFYVMEVYNLTAYQYEHGYWRWVMLCENGTNKGLNANEIIGRPINVNNLEKHINDCTNGVLPNFNKKEDEPKKTSQPFGWLSPTGEFTEGDFGEHEEVAAKIIEKKKFHAEFEDKMCEYDIYTARDFLSEVKGYVLIHNPSGLGGYIVSHVKPLTKKQKEFLYEYFMDLGDRWKAEQYLED